MPFVKKQNKKLCPGLRFSENSALLFACVQEKRHLLRAMSGNAALSDKRQQISAEVLKIVLVLAL